MLPLLTVQECVLALPADCEEQEMKREEIERLIDEKIKAILGGGTVTTQSGGGGVTNPPQPGQPPKGQ